MMIIRTSVATALTVSMTILNPILRVLIQIVWMQILLLNRVDFGDLDLDTSRLQRDARGCVFIDVKFFLSQIDLDHIFLIFFGFNVPFNAFNKGWNSFSIEFEGHQAMHMH
jgi:hypothetical protein